MVQKVNMIFSKPKGKMTVLPQIVIPNSRPALSNTLQYSVEMKQMLRRIQGLPNGCSSCGKKK